MTKSRRLEDVTGKVLTGNGAVAAERTVGKATTIENLPGRKGGRKLKCR
jgi:hypothetical protein